MTDATPGQIAMARRIADETIPEDSDAYEDHEARMADWYVARDAALAAIIETQRLDAALAYGHIVSGKDMRSRRAAATARKIATAIRAGQHYGKDEK